LPELQGIGSSGKAAVVFIKEIMNGYTKFTKIQRIQESQNKQDPTAEETALLAKLEKDPT
jgi:hypothetical protein